MRKKAFFVKGGGWDWLLKMLLWGLRGVPSPDLMPEPLVREIGLDLEVS